MSMQLMYTKVTNETLEKIKKDTELIDAIFMEGEAPLSDWDYDKDALETDFQTFTEIAEAIGEGVEIYDQDGWASKAIGQDYGSTLDFDFGYGDAFYFTPDEVRKIAAGLEEEIGDLGDPSTPNDFEDNVPGFFRIAAKEGKAVVGGVN